MAKIKKEQIEDAFLRNTGDTATGDISVPDEAYGVGWDTSTEVPTKNAVYDKVNELEGEIDTNTAHSTGSGSDHSDVALNTTHRTSNGSDHSYIDQDVTTTGTPSFSSVTTGDEAYNATNWNADLTVPTKNAVRDEIEANKVLIATQATDALVQSPTVTEDGYAIKWNNTNNEYELGPAGGGSFTDIDTDYGAETVSSAWDFTGDFSTQSMEDNGQLTINPTVTADNPNYSVVSDQPVTNLCENPRFENNVTDFWNDFGTVTRSRNTTEKLWGSASMQLTSSSANAGADTNTISGVASKTYVFSFWVKGAAGGERVQLALIGDSSGNTNTNEFLTYSIPNAVTTEWKRFRYYKTMTAGDTTLTCRIYTNSATAQTIYIDGVQIEERSVGDLGDYIPSAYCDGALGNGHSWSGTADNSTSSREAGTHYLAPVLANSQGGWIQRQDGTIDGKVHFRTDWGFKGNLDADEPLAPFMFTGNVETEIVNSGSSQAVTWFENEGDGAAMYLKSGVTTKEGFVLDFGSLTSGVGMAIYAPDPLDTMISSGGVFFKFAAKAAGKDMYKWGGDFSQAGDVGFTYDKRHLIYGGGGVDTTVGSSLTGTVSTTSASPTVTGTGTTFLTDYKKGDRFQWQYNGTAWETRTVESVASNTSLTLTSNSGRNTAAPRAHRRGDRQYSPGVYQMEGNYGNHNNSVADNIASLWSSGTDGNPRWLVSSSRNDTAIPTSDADGVGIVTSQDVDSVTQNVNNTTTETDIVTYSSTGHEFENSAGLRIKVYGQFTGNATTTTFTYRLAVGGTNIAVTPAQQVITTNATHYCIEAVLMRTSGDFFKGFISVEGKENSNSTNQYSTYDYGSSSTPNMETANDITLSVQCSDASSSFAKNMATVERL